MRQWRIRTVIFLFQRGVYTPLWIPPALLRSAQSPYSGVCAPLLTINAGRAGTGRTKEVGMGRDMYDEAARK